MLWGHGAWWRFETARAGWGPTHWSEWQTSEPAGSHLGPAGSSEWGLPQPSQWAPQLWSVLRQNGRNHLGL